jgi:prophage antirepressor-like protein
MPTETEFFRWWVTDEVTGKRRKTTFVMDRPTALKRYPGAEPDPATREVRNVYAPGEQMPSQYR